MLTGRAPTTFSFTRNSTGETQMEEMYQQFADRFAKAVIARDYRAAHSMLADWLQPTVSAAKLQEMIEKEIQEVCEANEIEEGCN
jgi:cell division protein YceG involved in septum cleavage